MFRSQGSEEALIIGRVLSGEREAFGLLVARHLPAVYAVAYAHTHNHADAEDVAQDAFLSALQSLDRLRDPRKFVSWTLSIARRGAIDAFRAKGRLSESEPPERGEDPRPEVERRELFALVERHLADLDEASREVLLLHYFAGLNGREIGQMLGVSHGAVRKRLERARETLGESILRDVGTARDVKSMLAQPAERISCAALAAPVAWKAGAAVALGTTGGGLAVLAKAAVTLAVVVASGVVAWTHLDRPGATPSSLAAPVVPPVPEASTKGVPSKATAAQSSESKSPALAAGQAATDEPRPQVLVRARKDSGGYAEPGSIRLHRVDPDSADVNTVDPAELQRIVQTTTNRRPPIVPKVDLAETGPAVFSGLPPGRYIAFWIDGSRELVSASGPVSFELKSNGNPIELTLDVTEGGVITGRVTDVATGRPLEGVEVHAHNANGYGPSPGLGKTDANGNYRIDGVCKGTFVLNPLQNLGFVPIPGADKLQTDVTPGKTSEGLDFVVRTTPSIRGRVLDAKGQPAAGVPVRAVAPYREGKPGYADGETNADGTFEVKGIEPTDGVYVGCNSHSGGKNLLSIVPAGPFTLTEAGLKDVVLRAQEPAEVSGVVVDSKGNPLAEATVTLGSADYADWEFSTESDGAGAFSFKAVYAAAYSLGAYLPARAESRAISLRSEGRVECVVRPGDQKTGLKLTVPTSDLTLSGTVRDASGNPIEGVGVTAVGCLDPTRALVYATDREGRFVIPGLPPGNCSVHAGGPSERYLPASKDSVPAGSVGVDFVLREAHFVEGCVVALGNGQPVTAFHVTITSPSEEDPTAEPRLVAERNVEDSAGRFEIPLYYEGTRDLTVAARAAGFGGGEAVLPGVAADKGASDIVLKLPRPATVKGTVFGPDGMPKLGVELLAGDIAIVSKQHRSYEPLTVTAADGTFEVKDLSGGPQVLTAYSPDAPPERMDISPKPGETQTVEVHLKRGAILEGDFALGGVLLAEDDRFLLRVYYEPDADLSDGYFAYPRGSSHYSFEHPLRPGRIWMYGRIEQEAGTAGLVERTVDLKEGERVKVDLDIPDGHCVIEGSIAMPEGSSGCWLELEMPIDDGKVTVMRWVKPGMCRFEDLPEGEGVARFRAVHAGPYIARTVPVRLTAGAPCRVDVDLR